MINVLIADDMKILRECLRMVINQYIEFKVVGCAENGKEAVEMTMEQKPDVVLMDLNMPIYSGHDAIRDIKAINKDIKILVLSVEGDERNITMAFKNGADGYVLKDIAPEELSTVMKKVYKGEKYALENAFSIGQEIVKIYKNPSEADIYLRVEFTEREKEVLELVMSGMTNEEIASSLGLSVGRARNIVADLISKCMVKNRTQLAVMGVKISMLL